MLLNYTTVSPRNHKSLIQNSLAGLTLKSFFNSNSDLSVKKPLNDRILNAMKTAAILEDNETQNHFIFESSLLRRSIFRSIRAAQLFEQPLLPLFELIKRLDLKETMVIQQCIKKILRSPKNLTPNIILVTFLDGYR